MSVNKEEAKILSHLALIIGKCDDLEAEIVTIKPASNINNSELSIRLESLAKQLQRIRLIIDNDNEILANMVGEISEKLSEVTAPVQKELNEIFECD